MSRSLSSLSDFTALVMEKLQSIDAQSPSDARLPAHAFQRTPHAFRCTPSGTLLPAHGFQPRLLADGFRRTAAGARLPAHAAGARLPAHGFRCTASGARLLAHGFRRTAPVTVTTASAPCARRSESAAPLSRARGSVGRWRTRPGEGGGVRGGGLGPPPPREGRHCQVNHLTCAPGSHLGTH